MSRSLSFIEFHTYLLRTGHRRFLVFQVGLETRLRNKYFVERKTVWQGRVVQMDLYRKMTTADIFKSGQLLPSVIIQLIRPTMSSITISRIVHSFDLDICGAAFDSKQVIISFACLQALTTGHSTYYAMSNVRSKSMKQVRRLHKYQQRGYNILCPKTFDLHTFLITPLDNDSNLSVHSYPSRKNYFGHNCDYFGAQKQFCEYYGLI